MSFLVFIFFLLLRPPQIVASVFCFCLSLRGALERGRKGLCEGEVEEGSARVSANRVVQGREREERGRRGEREEKRRGDGEGKRSEGEQERRGEERSRGKKPVRACMRVCV